MRQCNNLLFVALTVKSPSGGVAPQFVLPLSPVEVTEGQPAKLECRVVGAPVPTVKWLRDDEPLEPSDRVTIMYDGQLCEVNFTVTELDDEGEYKCVATNDFGKESSATELLINEPMTPITPTPTPIMEAVMPVSKQPIQFTVPIKEPIDEPARAPDKKPVEEKLKPEEKVPVKPEPVIKEKVAPIAFTPVQFALPLQKDEIGDVAPAFIEKPKDMEVIEGNPVTLTAVITGKPQPEVTWYIEEDKIEPSERVKVEQEGNKYKLVIRETEVDDEGVYRCIARNPAGKASCDAEILVEGSYCLFADIHRNL